MEEEIKDDDEVEEEVQKTNEWYTGKNSDFEDDLVEKDFEEQFKNYKEEEEEPAITTQLDEKEMKKKSLPYNEEEIDESEDIVEQEETLDDNEEEEERDDYDREPEPDLEESEEV